VIELLVVLLIAVGGPLLFWLAIRSETDDNRVTDRKAAEQAVRADTNTERDPQRDTRTERDPQRDTRTERDPQRDTRTERDPDEARP